MDWNEIEKLYEDFREEDLAIANDTWSGLRRIGDVPQVCLNPSHNPPMHMVLDPGIYEHRCPGCGQSTVFTVPRITC